MKRPSKYAAAALAASVAVSGCAGTPRFQAVKVKSNVATGHYVVTDNGKPVQNAGPGEVSLDRALDHDLVVSADGYRPRTVHIASEVQGDRVALYVCQIVLVPVIGLVAFLALGVPTHAWDDLVPNPADATLEPLDGSAAPTPDVGTSAAERK